MRFISFVILHYKDAETTDKCVQSILKMNSQELIHIVIVDNDIEKSSSERERLKRRYCRKSNIHVLKVTENGGFSYANNIGYVYSKEILGADFILILNNDIIFTQKNFITLLKQSFEKNKCHVLAPDIIRPDFDEHQNPMDTRIRTKREAEFTIFLNRVALKLYFFIYPFIYFHYKSAEKKRCLERKKNENFYTSIQKDIVPFGAGLIFTPLFVEYEKKAFEPETMFYYEEYILTLRCQRKGYTIVYDPSMCLLHESGKATQKRASTERERIRFMMKRTKEACKIYLSYLLTNISAMKDKRVHEDADLKF